MTRPIAPNLVRGLGLLALWSVVGLAFASQLYLSNSLLGRPITWREAISAPLEDWYVYGVLSLPVVWLARRFPPELGPRWRAAAIHLAAAVVFSFFYVALRAVVGQVDSWVAGGRNAERLPIGVARYVARVLHDALIAGTGL